MLLPRIFQAVATHCPFAGPVFATCPGNEREAAEPVRQLHMKTRQRAGL
jgi:hypothetical protein